jgi:protease PrsW
MTLLSYVLLGFAPGLLWLWYFRRQDDLEPEPRLLVLRVFLLGCAGAGLVLFLRPFYEWIVPHHPEWQRVVVDAFVATAFVEELAKVLAFVLGAYFHDEMDEPLDGIVYGIAAALGFASVENVVYIHLYDTPWVVLPRAFTSTLGHVAFTGSIGFFFGLARFSSRGHAYFLMILGFSLGVFFHGAYDAFLFLRAGPKVLALLLVLPLVLGLLAIKIRWTRALSPLYHVVRKKGGAKKEG